jgi:UDP-N-acetylmuramate: L-alanyl-gamma-D-glutamyl-meso-diaminopimelate ligase
MKIHLIAIGGSIMHNLAIALKKREYAISGSDDEIYEPAKTRLKDNDILPEVLGWFPGKINPALDMVILGMHAKKDNPELLKALELQLNIVSFPEFIYYAGQYKKRIVIAGSHGKTTTTAMVMHALKKMGKDFDYAVGSSIEGFDDSVRLSTEAPVIVIEGDEYLSSPIDRQPKFLWYKPQLAYITGIAWDHINVFPTYDEYFAQFINFVESMEEGSVLIYNPGDSEVLRLINNYGSHLKCIAANMRENYIEDNKTCVVCDDFIYELSVFGEHNLQNLAGAQKICEELNILEPVFWDSLESFKGAGKRLQTMYSSDNLIVFRDFAHAPSKVKASVEAVKKQYADRKLIAVLELHTFSSLNPAFIKEYAGSLDPADKAIIFINPETQKHKVSEPITLEQLVSAFGRKDLIFTESPEDISKLLENKSAEPICILLMSSGNFGNIRLEELINKLPSQK